MVHLNVYVICFQSVFAVLSEKSQGVSWVYSHVFFSFTKEGKQLCDFCLLPWVTKIFLSKGGLLLKEINALDKNG